MARLRVNTITDRNNSGSPSLTYGATIPSGNRLSVAGNVNLTGISTVGFLTASNANITGIITASFFKGDGSQLQGVPTVSSAKSVALKMILDPLPFRS